MFFLYVFSSGTRVEQIYLDVLLRSSSDACSSRIDFTVGGLQPDWLTSCSRIDLVQERIVTVGGLQPDWLTSFYLE